MSAQTQSQRDARIREANYLKVDVRMPHEGEHWRAKFAPHPEYRVLRVTPARVRALCVSCGAAETFQLRRSS